MRLEEMALLGLPIHTEFGEMKPLSVYDYMEVGGELVALSFDKLRCLHEIRLNQPEEKQESKEFTKVLEELNETYSLKNIIISFIPQFFSAYVEVLARCWVMDEDLVVVDEEGKELEGQEAKRKVSFDFLQQSSDEVFDAVRMMLLQINGQSEQTAFLDPLLQRKKEQSLRLKESQKKDSEKSSSPDTSTMVSSVVAFSGLPYVEVLKFNITQLIHTFQRISLMKAHDSSVVIATVAHDSANIVNWMENIEIKNDSNESSNFAMEYDKFKEQMGETLGGSD